MGLRFPAPDTICDLDAWTGGLRGSAKNLQFWLIFQGIPEVLAELLKAPKIGGARNSTRRPESTSALGPGSSPSLPSLPVASAPSK
jgi:hypothetical protein